MDRTTLVNQIKAIIPEEDMPKFKSMLETSSTSEIRNLYNSYARMYNMTADSRRNIYSQAFKELRSLIFQFFVHSDLQYSRSHKDLHSITNISKNKRHKLTFL